VAVFDDKIEITSLARLLPTVDFMGSEPGMAFRVSFIKKYRLIQMKNTEVV